MCPEEKRLRAAHGDQMCPEEYASRADINRTRGERELGTWSLGIYQIPISRKRTTEMTRQHSLKIATNLKLPRVGQPERMIRRRTPPVQEGGCFSGCIISHVHSVSRGAWEISVIVNTSVENGNSILEFKMLLTLFHNENHQIPINIWQTLT